MTMGDEVVLNKQLLVNKLVEVLNRFGEPTPFTPTLSASGSMTASSATGGTCKYWRLGKLVICSYYLTDIVLGGVTSSDIILSLPINAETSTFGGGNMIGNPGLLGGAFNITSATTCRFRKYDAGNLTLTTGNDIIAVVVYEGI